MKLIPALVLGLFSGYASASGFQLIEQSASGLGNAYAGSAASAENASTIFYNPAGMTKLKGTNFSGGVTLVKPSFKFQNEGSSTGSLTGNGGDGGELGVIPNFYFSKELTKELFFGVGFGAPFGLMTEYDSPWAGAAHSIKFDIKTYNINPSIAWKVNEQVSLGFGVNWQKFEAEYTRLGGVGTVVGGPLNGVPMNLIKSTMNLSDTAWGWNAGALFTLSEATKVGFSYRSAIKYELTGDVALGATNPAAAAAAAGVAANGGASNLKADLKLPDTYIISATQKLSDQWELLGDVSWTRWSTIPKLDVYRTSGAANGQLAQSMDTDFRDTWRVALGANYQYNSEWKFRYGIAYDQTPVKGAATRLASLPDNNRLWLSFGTQYKPSKDSAIDVGVAYLYVKDGKSNNDLSAGYPDRGSLNGTYKDSAWILGAQYSLAF
ncbi:OmpP1/FadL family transporter [Rhodocyclus tenuis]|uniref:OmpP1/FadL family transporter n=1 Tax=Rhodocyclus tenuis TaxID=1066 RepID=UPI001F5BAC94|nr:outer membrane protein transport protein [Rhodocyclus tenuis]